MLGISKSSVGLDIADHTIEIAQIRGSGKRAMVLNFGRVYLEPGIVERGRIKDAEKLKEALQKVFKQAKPKSITDKQIIFGLPESQVFLHNFTLPPHGKKERENLIAEEVKQNIPIEMDDVIYSYRVLKSGKDGVEILAVAANREVIQEWLSFFKTIKIEIEVLDVEILASFRDLFNTIPKEPVCVLDLGANTSFIGIFGSEGLRYEYTMDIAGNNFTNILAEKLKLDFEKAEKEKNKNGLKLKNKKAVEALQKRLDLIIKEIRISLDYFKKQNGLEVKELILIGGSSQLKGLDKYFGDSLELPIQIGSAKSMNKKVPLEYIEAIGLGLRACSKKWGVRDPDIPLLKIEKQIKTKKIDIVESQVVGEEEEDKEKIETKVEEETLDMEEDGEQEKNKNRKQVLLLIAFLIIGAIIVVLSFWYRGYAENKKRIQKEMEIQAKVEQIPVVIPEEPEEEILLDEFVTSTVTSTESEAETRNLRE